MRSTLCRKHSAIELAVRQQESKAANKCENSYYGFVLCRKRNAIELAVCPHGNEAAKKSTEPAAATCNSVVTTWTSMH